MKKALFISAFFSLFSFRLLDFISRYGVDLLYWDEWDNIKHLGEETSFFSLITATHNEHRIGTGILLLKFITYISDWDTRIMMYTTGILLIISTILAIALKIRITKRIGYTDALITFFTLNLFQQENLLWGFQPLFVLPFFFLFLILFICTFAYSSKKTLCIIFLCLLSTYSDFHGIYINIFVSLWIWKKQPYEKSTYLYVWLLFLISISYFFFLPKSTGLYRLHPLSEYIYFILSSISSVISHAPIHPVSYVILICSISITGIFFWKWYKHTLSEHMMFVWFLFLYSLFFSFSAAYGRIGILGVEGGHTSRYVTHMIPLFLGYYTLLSLSPSYPLYTLSASCILFFSFFSIMMQESKNYAIAKGKKDIREEWKTCILQENTPEICNMHTGYYIYPKEKTHILNKKISYLKNKNLHIFRNYVHAIQAPIP